MSNLEQEIQERTEAFAQELAELVKRAALESISQALAGGSVSASGGRGRRGTATRGAATRAAPAPRATASARRRKGEKRSPEQLEELTSQLVSEIKREGGRGIEAIAKAMNVSTKELALPIRKLNEEGKIKTKGQKRATKYFPK